MLGGGYRVLVFVGGAAVVGEGFGEPVGGAHEGSFGVDILCRKQREYENHGGGKLDKRV